MYLKELVLFDEKHETDVMKISGNKVSNIQFATVAMAFLKQGIRRNTPNFNCKLALSFMFIDEL